MKIKNIAVAAASGFVLSFLISIISTHKGGTSLVRALIFAIVFGVLAFGIEFLNGKFLDVEPSITEGNDDSSKTASKAGSVVNITIDDENLTEEDKGPAFNVNGGSFSYKASPLTAGPKATEVPVSAGIAGSAAAVSNESSGAVKAVETASEKTESAEKSDSAATSSSAATAASSSSTEGFKPVELGTPIKEGEVVKNDAASAKKGQAVKEIDDLPDIGSFGSGSMMDDSVESESVAPVINDSEFAQSGDVNASAAMTEGGDVLKQDTKIIAKAISTLLKKDEL